METQSYYTHIYGINDNYCDSFRPLRVNCAGYTNMSRIDRINGRRSDWYLQLMDMGHMRSGESEEFRAGQFIIRPPDKPYSYQRSPEGGGYFWIHFTGTWVESLFTSVNLVPDHIYTLKSGVIGGLVPEFTRLFRELMLRRDGFEEMAVSLLTAILVRLGRGVSRAEDSSAAMIRRRLEKSVQYIHDHYTEEIRIGTLADCEHLSVSRYRELFREAFGCPPGDYITDLRLTDACELLATSDLSVTEAAALCGYGDVLYFCRIFRKKKGISPGNFRKHSEEE